MRRHSLHDKRRAVYRDGADGDAVVGHWQARLRVEGEAVLEEALKTHDSRLHGWALRAIASLGAGAIKYFPLLRELLDEKGDSGDPELLARAYAAAGSEGVRWCYDELRYPGVVSEGVVRAFVLFGSRASFAGERLRVTLRSPRCRLTRPYIEAIFAVGDGEALLKDLEASLESFESPRRSLDIVEALGTRGDRLAPVIVKTLLHGEESLAFKSLRVVRGACLRNPETARSVLEDLERLSSTWLRIEALALLVDCGLRDQRLTDICRRYGHSADPRLKRYAQKYLSSIVPGDQVLNTGAGIAEDRRREARGPSDGDQ